ncbi:hypothetical protein BDV23DRAFT_182343 [Aspergillus alliaceus]|uniref:Uncharacterized protein n=1 Tax=Petromyces alliaceus TaxID=209559 RepID=A0A5N7CD70_PETAA|nr:hypothetical protein BDV23DRAFT_182343 [Aspergillus alliaceus]
MAVEHRASRLSGSPPPTLPIWAEGGDSVFDVPALESRKAYSLVLAAKESAPRYINHVTVETLAALAKWTPGPLIERMHYNPSSETAYHAREALHLGLLTGPGRRTGLKLQVDFVRDVVDSASRAML